MKISIKKNYLYNLMYQIMVVLIPLITTPYLSRVLGVKGVGIYSYTLSICSYFILFGSVGVASYGQREIAMNRNSKRKYSKIFWELFIFRLITTCLSLFIYIAFIINIKQYNLIFLILSIEIFASILDISWFYQGLEEYKFLSIRNILLKLLLVVSLFIFVKNKNHLTLYVLLNALFVLFCSLSLWIKLPKLIDKPKIKKLQIIKHLKPTLIYFLPQIATQVYTMLDKTMLGIITGSQIENGYYAQAYKIITMSMTIIISLNTVMSSRMSYLFNEGKIDEMKKRLLKSMKFSALLSFPMMIGIAITSNGFVDWFFGLGYEKVKILLICFSPLILIISLSNCLGGQCLVPCNKRLSSALALICGAVLNFILNLFLIKRYASIGAVFSSVMAELIITVLFFKLSKDYITFKKFVIESYKYLISSIIMGIITFITYKLLPYGVISTLIEVVIGIIIYFVCLIIFKDSLVLETIQLIKNKIIKKVE